MCQNLRLSCPHLMDDDWYARGATGDLMRILDSIPEVQDGIRGCYCTVIGPILVGPWGVSLPSNILRLVPKPGISVSKVRPRSDKNNPEGPHLHENN